MSWNADVADVAVSGTTYAKRDGRLILQAQLADPLGYKSLNPPVIKGYTPNEFYSRMDTRLNRPRYYYSTPSGLPY
jgi:hypothetical protein